MTQFFTPLTEPVGALWFLMVLGVLWLFCRRHWRSALWLGLPTVVLFVIGSTPLTETLVASEEQQWAGNSEGGSQKTEVGILENGKQKVETQESSIGNLKSEMTFDAVVALGGGVRVSANDPLGFAFEDGASRNFTAIELVRDGKARTLVLGGSWPLPGHPDLPSMSLVQAWVTGWGLVGGATTNLGVCINTHDEAIAFQKLARSQGWSRVILVTSALHMRRSAALFEKQGIDVTPVAADFQALGVPPDPFSPFPREHRLSLMTLYLHEKIGWWVYKWRGWV